MISGGAARRVPVHDVLRPLLTAMPFAPIATDAGDPLFTIDQCWARGQYAESLFAPSDNRSFSWRGDYIREHLPLLPLDRHGDPLDPAPLWLHLARFNGSPQAAVQKILGLDAATVERILQLAEQQEVLFRLPYWAPPGEPAARTPLVYWCDSGLLHRLLDQRDPAALNAHLRGKSYEGFVIGAIAAAAAPSATTRVWARDQDEIDVVVEWSGGERWAVEITLSPSKKLSRGFQRGCDEIGVDRALVVQARSGRNSPTTFEERLLLVDVLRELREIEGGPAALVGSSVGLTAELFRDSLDGPLP